MRYLVVFIALAMLLGCSKMNQEQKADTGAKTIQWATESFEAVMAKAAKEARPVMLDFYTDW